MSVDLAKFQNGVEFRPDTTDKERLQVVELGNMWLVNYPSLPYGMRFYLNEAGDWYNADNELLKGFDKLHEFDAKCHENGWKIDNIDHIMDDYHPTIAVTWRRIEDGYPW